MNQYSLSLIGFFSFAILLIIIEILSRRFKLPAEWIRRVSHLLAALFTVYLSFYLDSSFLLTILAIFSVVIFTSRLLKIFNHIHAVSRPTIGEELLPIGFIAAYLISNGQSTIFIPSILVVGIADPITGIMMQKWKKHFWGIVIFTVVTVVIVLLFTNSTLITASIIAFSVALVERISPYGTDNLSIPAITALLLSTVKI